MCNNCKEQTPIECHVCDTDITESDINICQDCSNPTCDDCNTLYESASLCDKCKQENYTTCDNCNKLTPTDDSICADDSIYCTACHDNLYTECDDCGASVLNDNTYRIRSNHVCDDCYCTNYNTCNNCGDSYHNDDGSYCDNCDSCHCSNCSCDCGDSEIDLVEHGNDLANLGSSAIADYHPSIEWEFKADKLDDNNAPYFGVELEIECTDRNLSAKTVGKLLKGKAIATHDGSLSNGFEIVFTPHKYQAFRKLNFTNILKEISLSKATSHDSGTCGLHVHLTRNQWFNKSIKYKGERFDNSDLYQSFYNILSDDITKLSRRTQTQINNYCSFKTTRGERYAAVNLCPSNTVEIRIWRGTLNPKRFKANIQFTLAVYYFLQQHSKALLFQNKNKLRTIFANWLSSQSEYVHLVNYCKDKKLFGFTHRKQQALPIEIKPTSKPEQTIIGTITNYHISYNPLMYVSNL